MLRRRLIKKNRKRKKLRLGNLLSIGTICVVLIVAFGVLGASYASWHQSLTFFGSVNTGKINVVVRDVVLENLDSYESVSLDKKMEANRVEQVNMNIVTDADPFSGTIVFIVDNNGTIPVVCEGIDLNISGNLEAELVNSHERIEVGQTASVKVRITKGYCNDFEFSTFLRFVQATG